MMKHFMMTLIALFCFINVQAQKITRSYDNVSMSEALRDLNEQTHEYNISFLYNELEDFRVTTNIRRKSISGAIIQVIGFYPVRVVKRGENEIYVECTHKTERHLTGTIIDENRQPVPYANIAVLNPADSTSFVVASPMRAAFLLFLLIKPISSPVSPTSVTRRFLSNVITLCLVQYKCSQRRKH